MQDPKVAVFIINWNAATLTVECAEALLAGEFTDFDVYLLDNGSARKDVVELKEWVEQNPKQNLYFFEEKRNLGFSRGCNFLLEQSAIKSYEFIALLNNDAVPSRQWLKKLVERAVKSNCDMVASKIRMYEQDGRIDNAGLMLLTSSEILPIGARNRADEHNEVRDVMAPSAGAGLYKRALFDSFGGFDDYFENLYEDAELGLRFHLCGANCFYEPEADVLHRISYSVNKTKTPRYGRTLQRNILYTYFKLIPSRYLILYFPLILLRILVLLLLSLITFRMLLFKSQYGGIHDFIKDRKLVKQKRNAFYQNEFELRPKLQFTSFWKVYVSYFKRFIAGREATILE